MDFNKVLFVAVLGIVAIILLDTYNKYDVGRRKDNLKAQEQANQSLIQLQQIQADQLAGGGDSGGFLGNILGGIPLIGGLF